jgi:hypothetical protein
MKIDSSKEKHTQNHKKRMEKEINTSKGIIKNGFFEMKR